MCSTKAAEAVKIIARQREALESITDDLEMRLPQWRDRTFRFLGDVITMEELRLLAAIDTSSLTEDRKKYLRHLKELEDGVRELPQQYLAPDALPEVEARTEGKGRSRTAPKKGHPQRVFVVHGHDSLAKTEVARTLEKLGLQAIVLHEQANEGRTIIEKFERDASQVSFAVVLLTPDDIGHPKNKPDDAKPRARQNVILELGYFSGILGRRRVCVLHKGDVEIPSDYLGVVYVPLDDVGAWRFSLGREMKQAGVDVDLNKLA